MSGMSEFLQQSIQMTALTTAKLRLAAATHRPVGPGWSEWKELQHVVKVHSYRLSARLSAPLFLDDMLLHPKRMGRRSFGLLRLLPQHHAQVEGLPVDPWRTYALVLVR